MDEVTLTFVRERKPVKLLKKLQKEKFYIEEKWPGIYYIIKERHIRIQIVVSRELSWENHVWLNSLSNTVNVQQAIELIEITEQLEKMDDKNYAESLWDVVESMNKETIQRVREDNGMACRVLTEIMQPKIDEAFNNGFNNGFSNGSLDKGISIFKNMIKEGVSRELAQKCAEISDELAEKALSEI